MSYVLQAIPLLLLLAVFWYELNRRDFDKFVAKRDEREQLDWERNHWLNAKDTILGTWRRP